MSTIAIIGASGFVGSTLAERLLANGRYDVVPFIHSSGNAWMLARLGIELKRIDLLDAQTVERALSGVTHVVNCSRGGDDVMLEGLKNLLAASQKQAVQRFIHLSSVAVYGDPPPAESVSESAPTIPDRGTYGWVKLQQDRLVARAAREGLSCITLCPPNISGPNSPYFASLIDALRHNEFAFLEEGASPCSLVDVTNLSVAIELSLFNGPRDGDRLFITDDEATTWRFVIERLTSVAELAASTPTISREQLSLMDAPRKPRRSVAASLKHVVSSEVRQALRKDPLWESIDSSVRRGVTRLGKSAENALRISIEGPIKIDKAVPEQRINARLCRQQLRGVLHSCERAKRLLDYRPLYTVAESMEAFRKWYRAHNGMDSNVWPLLRHLY